MVKAKPIISTWLRQRKQQVTVGAFAFLSASWLLSGIYIVNLNELAVVQIFGRVVAKTSSQELITVCHFQ
ncbi:MAG: hypothetical protein ACUVSC_13240 [Candidatus Fervidibacter sp.]|uniref:hypothetical protein n=1 Tax=Candidatus Fervidibacter sp. TaxID=3100871 RepID=UPI00404915A6